MSWQGLLSPLTEAFRKKFSAWMDSRQPAVSTAHLAHRNIYILPTRQGAGFLLLIAMLWLMGTNYENNLVLALGFFLLAVLLAAIFLTHRNIDGLNLEIVGSPSPFAGQLVELELQIEECEGRARSAVELAFPLGNFLVVDIPAKATISCKITLPTQQRGWFKPGRLRVRSVYPLGMFRAWSLPLLNAEIVVYPSPADLPLKGGVGQGSSGRKDPAGIEELAGIDAWQEGSGLQRVAWKQYAAGRGMFEKRFEEGASDPMWLDWDDHQGTVEQKLSALCARAVDHARRLQPYGLRLPNERLEPASGEMHLHRVLTRLALFES